ncbi:MAG: UvrD-helicase domain-containing protein, partial [Pontiellaceae bacterium]
MNTFFNSSAGTGKTYRLTDKYKKLILENNIDPHEILLMTFTKNAAAELKSEVIKKISNEILEFDTIKEDKQRYLMQRVYSAPICT